MQKRKLKIRKANKNVKAIAGSLTVEASFVMPIVILMVFALIYLAFYLHDINRIQAVLDLSIHKAGMNVKHEADIASGEVTYDNIGERGVFYILFGNTEDEERKLKEYIKENITKGLFLAKVKQINVKVDKLKVTASIEVNTVVNLPGISHLFRSFTDVKISGDYPVHNPAETVRVTSVILDTGSKIKGVDKIKEKIESIFGTD